MRTNAENDRVRASSNRHTNDCQGWRYSVSAKRRYRTDGRWRAPEPRGRPRDADRSPEAVPGRRTSANVGRVSSNGASRPDSASESEFPLFPVYWATIAVASDISPIRFAAGRSAAELWKTNGRTSSDLNSSDSSFFSLFFLYRTEYRPYWFFGTERRACNARVIFVLAYGVEYVVDRVNISLVTIDHMWFFSC